MIKIIKRLLGIKPKQKPVAKKPAVIAMIDNSILLRGKN